MYFNEIIGGGNNVETADPIESKNLKKIGVFASDLFFFKNQNERLQFAKKFYSWYMSYSQVH